jgi:hypothetical protein
MTLMLRPLRGMRSSQDLDVGVMSLGLGEREGAGALCLTTANSYQITPERHLSLARLMSSEMARIHGPLSVKTCC